MSPPVGARGGGRRRNSGVAALHAGSVTRALRSGIRAPEKVPDYQTLTLDKWGQLAKFVPVPSTNLVTLGTRCVKYDATRIATKQVSCLGACASMMFDGPGYD